MVKRRFLCSLLCCSPCCAFLALVGANTRFVGANAMFATFAPRILWFAHTIAAFAPRNLRFAPPNTSFALGIFSKTHQSSLTLKGGSTSHLGLLPSGKKRKPPYSVLKPLRYKVGGPSEVFASSGAAVCGMRPHGHESLRGCR